MTIILTVDLLRKIFPKISDQQARAFVDHQSDMSEILASVKRTALCFANVWAETAGFNNAIVVNMTENTNYTAERVAAVWPNRFNRGKDANGKWIPDPSKVRAKYGTGPDWRKKAFNDIYGTRMGNRPGTNDGWNFIGRGAPQITGRDGYDEIGRRIGIDLTATPQRACEPELQPTIIAAFWAWKKLSPLADAGQLVVARERWNGGHNGLDVVRAQYPRIVGILQSGKPATAAPVVIAPTAKVDEDLRDYQQALIDCGYHEVGEADGKIGGKTLGAIKAFFTDRGIEASAEYPSQALHNALNAAIQEDWHRPIAPGRAFATEQDLTRKVSSIAPAQSAGFFAKIGAWFSGGATVVGGAVQVMPTVSDQISPYKSFIQEYFPSIPTLLIFAVIAAVAIYTVMQVNKSKQATIDDFQRGKIN
jgi:predicted chitinase